MKQIILALVGVCFAATIVFAGERPSVDVKCKATDDDFVYHCMFKVVGRKSKEPMEGVDFSVSADMPSMPMAHNIPPFKPQPVDGKPGMYHGNLELEMMGEWALKMEFKAPARDILIEKFTFSESDEKMDHSTDKMEETSRGSQSD